MTKTWDDVREYVCRLYQIERKSLRQIEETLLRERHFKASTRAYRSKLKEWRVKRDGRYVNANDQPGAVCCRQSISCQHSDAQASSAHSLEYGFGNVHNESEGSASITRTAASALPIHYITLPARLTGNDVPLALNGNEPRDDYQTFKLTTFAEGQDTMLHELARERGTDLIWFQRVVDFMQRHHVSIDIRDHGGETALEAAIRAGNCNNVVHLLSKGASVTTRNAIGQQPLHVSLTADISNKVELYEALLSHNADPTSFISTGTNTGDNATVTFLKHIANRSYLGDRMGDYDLCSRILHPKYRHRLVFFSQDIEFDPRSGSAFRRFLDGWRAPVHFENPDEEYYEEVADSDALAVKCLKSFLRKGFDPFTIGSAGYLCPQGRCRDFASLAFFHAADTTCSDRIVRYSDPQYTRRLFDLWLDPCRCRLSAGRSVSMSDQLSLLLSLRTLPEDFLSDFLQSPAMLYGKDPETLNMLRIIVESKNCDLHQRDSHGHRPVEYLTRIPEPLRWHVAETLLSAEVTAQAGWYYCDDDIRALFSLRDFPPDVEEMEICLRNHLGHLERYIARGCTKTHFLREHRRYQETLGSKNEVYELQRCIIHAASKHFWHDKPQLFSDPRWAKLRLIRDIGIRQKLGLPGIQIDSGILHELLRESTDREPENA